MRYVLAIIILCAFFDLALAAQKRPEFDWKKHDYQQCLSNTSEERRGE